MARAAREVVGVMDETTTKAANAQDEREDQPHPRQGDPGRPVRGELHGPGHPGAHLRAPLDHAGRPPYDEITWELPHRRDQERVGQDRLRAEGHRGPQLLEPARHQRRRQQVLPRPHRHARARDAASSSSSTASSTRSPPGPQTQHYFATDEDLATFKAELTHLLVHQKMASTRRSGSTSGVEARPQCSACFINSVQDDMGSIMDLAKTEAMLFKYGSGAGVNLSPIRGRKERLAGGGIASGPVSFMKGFDAFAGVVKSGGTTRRAAKMVILDADHPDVIDFIDSKANEEKKAWALIEQGYDPSFTGEAYGSVFFQNANHSVRVTDEFMRAVENGRRLDDPRRHRRRDRRAPTRRARSSGGWPRPPGSAATRASSTTPRSTTGTRRRTRTASTPATRAASTCS